MNNKKRLDVYLYDFGISRSRNRAKEEIKNRCISVNNKIIDKPSYLVNEGDLVEKIKNYCNYVSRGGLKLKKAIEYYDIDINDKICLDVGASTGGFSQCLLDHGAKKIYAIDVGKNQLADELRKDNRVISKEGINARTYDFTDYNDVELICVDVSFISLDKILNNLFKYFKTNFIVLIKPQFEVGFEYLGNSGVVKDKNQVIRVLEYYKRFFKNNCYLVNEYIKSPIKGQKGNIEYLSYLERK